MKIYDEKQCLLVKKVDDIFQAMDITEKTAELMGFPQSDKLFLRLVTEEACMNAYEYCQKTNQHGFSISWKVDYDFLTIFIKHKGKKFNINVLNHKINYGLRGRGLQLIVKLMDHVQLVQNGEYVEFIMKKNVKAKIVKEGADL